VASILLHGVAIGLLAFGLMHAPRINELASAERLTVSRIQLQAPDLQKHPPAKSDIRFPGPQPTERQPDPKPPAPAPLLQQIAKAAAASKMLLQPDLPPHPELTQQIPVPNIVLWKSPKIQVKTIVPDRPSRPTAAEIKPSLDAPNHEVFLADIRISSSELSSMKLPVLPSTTSPLVVHGPELPQATPATSSVSSLTPTPTSVLSLSGLRMTAGTAYVPPQNTTSTSISLGTAEGDPASKGGGTGTGQPTANFGGAKTGTPNGVEDGSGDQPSTTHIALAKEGQFGAVVVGSSLEERYPEAAVLMNGKLVYTVYLHIGLARSWILQYSLPVAETPAAAANTTSLQAPWPYNIVRPNIPAGAFNADVLMIHGFVNKDGRFESLAVAFPPEFAHKQFVLDALMQWEFRPAMQAGKAARVEVLLIVPSELQ
jgi:hypothetical protein